MPITHTRDRDTRTSDGDDLAGALHDLRKARDLSLYAVAKRTGVPRTVLERLEVDATNAKYGHLVTLAEFYGLPRTSDLVALGEHRRTHAA
ncbi:helix-turn-helix domain-containing protein [Promicromonospora vindobonensis]|uniref:Helix-turn-helix domain-containing protein n=1 Tax=Promicromonospora vindobonensis TaxID=195748 RepID=A0ABW5VMK0_9MICO